MSASQSRLTDLDALRGVAVLFVLAYHYSIRFRELFPNAPHSSLHFSPGQYGVHLFFAISGFVITMTLERSRRPLDFVVARFSRLYPAYWIAILVTSLSLWLFGGPLGTPTAAQVMVNFSMLQEFVRVESVDGVYWTLEVELLFYGLALALFCLGLLKRVYLPVSIWLALSAFWWANAAWDTPLAASRYAALAGHYLILEYAPFFVIGMMFYRAYRSQGSALWNYVLIAASLALILVFQPLVVGALIASACVVFWKLSRGGLLALRFPPLVFIGTISYPLYLLHQKIGYEVMLGMIARGWGPASSMLAAALVCLALAAALTFSVERPAMRAIRRCYRRASAVQAQAATSTAS